MIALSSKAPAARRLIDPPDPAYPIYVVSKGRAGNGQTAPRLAAMGVDYRIIVEPSEFAVYAAIYGADRLIPVDEGERRSYDPLDGLGGDLPLGSGPARNTAWAHAESEGAERHWVLDDNIHGWGVYVPRGGGNRKRAVADGSAFAVLERFADRYRNIALSAHQYAFFVGHSDRSRVPPLIWNTRVMSSILIKTSLRPRWQGRYNEDVILSIEALKPGWCNALHMSVFADKVPRSPNAGGGQSGGNTDTVYAAGAESELAKAMMLKRRYPGMVRLARRYGRVHHVVDFGRLRLNKPIRVSC